VSDKDLFAKVRASARAKELREVRAAGLLPFFRRLEGDAGPWPLMEGQRRLMLGSNNYLGLTADERVRRAARDALDRYGVGLTGSRLLNGTTPLHLELEAELADWMGAEDALVLTTGYQANVAVIAALCGEGDTVACDSANHASILDGIAMSGARIAPFRHRRMEKLRGVLRRWSDGPGGALVIVDGVFSMEGDLADLETIAVLSAAAGARLAVDEAHAVGVLGPTGAGATELFGAEEAVDLRIGTFSKSLATCGGFVAGGAEIIEYLRFEARPFLFTASNVPAAVGAALAAVRIARSADGDERRERLAANARRLREGLMSLGLDVGPASREADGTEVQVPIVPVIVGDDTACGMLWNSLYDRGLFCNAVFYPAVPQGRQLLRTSVMATHTPADIDRAVEIFAQAVREGFPWLIEGARSRAA
jgi:8-amino-7-oxononanoate synthase